MMRSEGAVIVWLQVKTWAFRAEEFTSRTRETHAHHIQDMTDFLATTYGVERDSILNESAYFHMTEGLPSDTMQMF
jgi:hypothetical protein